MEISRKSLFHLSLFTLLGMSAIGFFVIHLFHDIHWLQVMKEGKQWHVQLMIGGGYGLGTSLLAVLMVNHPMLKDANEFFSELIQKVDPSFHHILFYSACAAIGEEILFRGAIQPLIGIWVTAIIFVLLHGYVNPLNVQMSIYGLFLIIISAGFGYLFKFLGIWSAIAAHFIYDVVMFSKMTYFNARVEVED